MSNNLTLTKEDREMLSLAATALGHRAYDSDDMWAVAARRARKLMDDFDAASLQQFDEDESPKQVRPIDYNMVRDFKVAFHQSADADPTKMNYDESVRRGLEAVVAGLVKVAVTDELVEQGRAAFARAGWKPVGKSTMRSALEAVLGADGNRERRDMFAAAVDVETYTPLSNLRERLGRNPTVLEMADYVADIRRIEAAALIRALDNQVSHD